MATIKEMLETEHKRDRQDVIHLFGEGTFWRAYEQSAWLTYFLDHVHEYDNDYSKDLADFLPANLMAKGILKKSETLQKS